MNLKNPDTAHWRDSARMPQFFGIDATAALPLPVFLLHIKLWTFFLAIAVGAFFAILNKFGFTIAIFKRWLRNFLAGNHKIVRY
jgi:intracellular multiplication protein IcmT